MPIKPHDFLPDPPRGIYRFIEKMKSAALAAHEKRQRPRHSIMAVVVAQPCNAAGNLAGEPFKAVTRDLSTAGLSLLHTRMVKAKFLSIEILNHHGEPIRAHLEVIRCHPVGPFYSIAGSFVERTVAKRGIPEAVYDSSSSVGIDESPMPSEAVGGSEGSEVATAVASKQPAEVTANVGEELVAATP